MMHQRDFVVLLLVAMFLFLAVMFAGLNYSDLAIGFGSASVAMALTMVVVSFFEKKDAGSGKRQV